MKHTLFLVHGMGKHAGTAWQNAVTKELNEAMRNYAHLNNNGKLLSTIQNMLNIVPVEYDSCFEDQRADWAANAAQVLQFIQANPDTNFGGILGDSEARHILKLQEKSTNDNFFNTHILDVLLYRFSSRGEQVRVSVAEQILDALRTGAGETTRGYSIIAHSLGTAVTHDALHALHTTDLRNNLPSETEYSALHKASNIIMIANVSRALQSRNRSTDAYLSTVRPSKGRTKSACKFMINASHDFDPFAQTKPFRPTLDTWLDPDRTVVDSDGSLVPIFQSINIRQVTDLNVHSWTHYLKHPDVHIPILNQLTSTNIGTEEREAAMVNYLEGTLGGKIKEFTDSLEQISIREPTSIQEIVTAWSMFDRVVQKFEIGG